MSHLRWLLLLGIFFVVGCTQTSPKPTANWKIEVRGGTLNADDNPTAQSGRPSTRELARQLLRQQLGIATPKSGKVAPQTAKVSDVYLYLAPTKNGAKPNQALAFEVVGPSAPDVVNTIAFSAERSWRVMATPALGSGEYQVSMSPEGNKVTAKVSIDQQQVLAIPKLTKGTFLPNYTGISAEWNPVSGAQTYQLALFSGTGDFLKGVTASEAKADLQYTLAPNKPYTVIVLAYSWDITKSFTEAYPSPPTQFNASAAEYPVFITGGTPSPPAPSLQGPSPAKLDLSSITGNIIRRNISIYNQGTASLNYTTTLGGDSAFRVAAGATGSLASGNSAIIAIEATCPNSVGVRTGTLGLQSNDPYRPSIEVPLRLDCLQALQAELVYNLFGHGFTYSNYTPIAGSDFSPDGSKIVTYGGDGRVILWDATNGRALSLLNPGSTSGSADSTGSSIVWSPNGSRIAAISRDRNLVRIWNSSTAQEILAISGPAYFNGLAWSPDGSKIAVMSQEDIVVYETTSGNQTLRFTAGTGSYNSSSTLVLVGWNSDGTRLYTLGTLDSTRAVFKVWQASNGALVSSFEYDYTSYAYPYSFPAALNPSGSLLATRYFNTTTNQYQVRLLNTNNGSVQRTFRTSTDPFYGLTWNRNGDRLMVLTGDGCSNCGNPKQTEVWQTSDDTLIRSIGSPSGTAAYGGSISSDGNRILLPQFSGLNTVVLVSTGASQLTLGTHTNNVSALSFDSTNARLASGSWSEGYVLAWHNLSSKLATSLGNPSKTNTVAVNWISSDSKLATLESTNSELLYKVFNVASGQQESSLSLGAVGFLGWSSDARKVLFYKASSAINIYNADSNTFVELETGNSSSNNFFAWSPDNTRLVRFGSFGLVFYNAQTGKIIKTINNANLGFGNSRGFWIGNQIISSDSSSRWSIFDVTTEAVTAVEDQNTSNSSLWAIDSTGRYLLVSNYTSLQVMTLSGTTLLSIPMDDLRSVTSATWSKDGNYIAVGGQLGGIRVWRVSPKP